VRRDVVALHVVRALSPRWTDCAQAKDEAVFYDHQAFTASYEKVFSKLTASQYEGIDQILGFIQLDPYITDDHWGAYMLATVKHECANSFHPITEFGADSYFNKYEPGTTIGARLGNTKAGDGLRYKGRGYVQITGRANYLKLSTKLGLGKALIAQPALALEPVNAYRIMSVGMRDGLFTGKKLSTYVNDAGCDYVNARRIINGQDKAVEIADYADKLESALRAARLD
jgi:hypothetical protein